jgi:predicted enzyme related to lactoylglutathione lyase
MIAIKEAVSWADSGEGSRERGSVHGLVVHVANLDRAAAFYERVFGFRRSIGDSAASCDAVALQLSGLPTLVLHQWPRRGSAPRPLQRWAFVVAENLEEVRGRVWELGVKIARDSGAPDQVYRRATGDSLYVFDADGNEIELVERSSAERGMSARPAGGDARRSAGRRDAAARVIA